MKKIALFLALLMAFSFCACGNEEAKNPVTTEPPVVQSELPSDTPEPIESEESETSLKDTASKFIDKDVSELIAAIGEPVKSEYVGSCIGTGEDGVLSYEGFSVYTYKEGNSEVVRIVD